MVDEHPGKHDRDRDDRARRGVGRAGQRAAPGADDPHRHRRAADRGSGDVRGEMKQAVELALAEQNAGGGLLGGRVEARVADDEANDAKGLAVARGFCEDPRILGVVGHVNSNVSISASTAYQACGLLMITPMSSHPGVTDRGLPNVFRLTNRDDHKGPGLAAYLYRTVGKHRAVVVDDQTAYGKGLADLLAKAFTDLGGAVVDRPTVRVGDRDSWAVL